MKSVHPAAKTISEAVSQAVAGYNLQAETNNDNQPSHRYWRRTTYK